MATPARTAQTRDDLLRDVPNVQRDGAFPRQLLLPGEEIIFETRPAFFSRYYGRLIVFVLIFLLGAASSDNRSSFKTLSLHSSLPSESS